MDYDFLDQERPTAGSRIANFLSVLVILVTIGIGGLFVLVFVNPYLPINPFPPPTLAPTVPGPPATSTPEISLPPTWTPTPALTASPTLPASPTATLTATATPAPITPSPTPPPPTQVPSATPEGYQFELQPGNPVAIPDEGGCDVMGIAGKVFSLDLAPIVGLEIRVGGDLGGQPVGPTGKIHTGDARERFGDGGYYVPLASEPIASQKTVWIQVLDSATGEPYSARVYITTYATCDRNLILVHWIQVP